MREDDDDRLTVHVRTGFTPEEIEQIDTARGAGRNPDARSERSRWIRTCLVSVLDRQDPAPVTTHDPVQALAAWGQQHGCVPAYVYRELDPTPLVECKCVCAGDQAVQTASTVEEAQRAAAAMLVACFASRESGEALLRRVAFRMSESEVAELDRRRGAAPRARWIREMVLRSIAERAA